MYCKNCGQQINDNADVCIYCGVAVNQGISSKATKYSPWAITGMVVSLVSIFFNLFAIVPTIGVIFSGIGMKQTADGQMRGRGMAITGLVIGIIGITYMIIILAVATSY